MPLAVTLRSLREYGWNGKYRAELTGGRNSRLDELQAAVLRARLPLLDGENRRRRDIARRYAALLSGSGLILPPDPDEADVCHLYVVRTPQRDALLAALRQAGIGCDIHYPVPDHRQAVLRDLDCSRTSLPETERAVADVVSLPCFPELTDAEVEMVAATVRGAMSDLSGAGP